MSAPRIDRFGRAIRAKLLESPDAGLCRIGDCQVITQGREGAERHRLVVHPEWVPRPGPRSRRP